MTNLKDYDRGEGELSDFDEAIPGYDIAIPPVFTFVDNRGKPLNTLEVYKIFKNTDSQYIAEWFYDTDSDSSKYAVGARMNLWDSSHDWVASVEFSGGNSPTNESLSGMANAIMQYLAGDNKLIPPNNGGSPNSGAVLPTSPLIVPPERRLIAV